MYLRNIPDYVKLVLGIEKNETLGFSVVTKIAKRFIPNYRFTWPELAWFRSASLTAVLSKFDENDGYNAHRRLALQQLLRLTFAIPGDTAECGVYKGCGSHIILQANRQSLLPRVHHLFDSFEGLSNPSEKDGSYWSSHDLSIGEQVVKANLAEFDGLELHKGWIPDRFGDVQNQMFSFVHVDVDLYQPTLDSISFFYEKLSVGGIFVCDDYGFLTCPGATLAMNEFLQARPEKMVALPGGGGFFIKGCKTAAE